MAAFPAVGVRNPIRNPGISFALKTLLVVTFARHALPDRSVVHGTIARWFWDVTLAETARFPIGRGTNLTRMTTFPFGNFGDPTVVFAFKALGVVAFSLFAAAPFTAIANRLRDVTRIETIRLPIDVGTNVTRVAPLPVGVNGNPIIRSITLKTLSLVAHAILAIAKMATVLKRFGFAALGETVWLPVQRRTNCTGMTARPIRIFSDPMVISTLGTLGVGAIASQAITPLTTIAWW